MADIVRPFLNYHQVVATLVLRRSNFVETLAVLVHACIPPIGLLDCVSITTRYPYKLQSEKRLYTQFVRIQVSIIKTAHLGVAPALGRLGFTCTFEVEQKPKFSWSALGCLLLGFAQVLGGAAVCIFSCGAAASFGLGLITEGISDMTEGITGMIDGSFSWAKWAIQKAISLATSLLCWGIGKLSKIATRTLGSVQKALRAPKQMSYSVKEATKAGIGAMKQAAGDAGKAAVRKTVMKEVGKACVKEVAWTAANEALSALLSKGLEELVVRIVATLRQNFESDLKRCECFCSAVRKGIASLDKVCEQWNNAAKTVCSHKGATVTEVLHQCYGVMDQFSNKLRGKKQEATFSSCSCPH